ncbi:hypothetical protein DSO57_1013207 [Entomophthora muscae]|uniref:Uncharacterized protein n=1 Tax=Entomophthora muscae TaxID=34485 RepID=A0ACC2S7W7_9FUNG|nr:hypothetical protein DSO57_1013207 [Entomophthora muscae]
MSRDVNPVACVESGINEPHIGRQLITAKSNMKVTSILVLAVALVSSSPLFSSKAPQRNTT